MQVELACTTATQRDAYSIHSSGTAEQDTPSPTPKWNHKPSHLYPTWSVESRRLAPRSCRHAETSTESSVQALDNQGYPKTCTTTAHLPSISDEAEITAVPPPTFKHPHQKSALSKILWLPSSTSGSQVETHFPLSVQEPNHKLTHFASFDTAFSRTHALTVLGSHREKAVQAGTMSCSNQAKTSSTNTV